VVAGPAICPPSVGCQYVPLRVGLTDGDVDRVWLGDDQRDLLVGETGPLSPAHAQLTAEGRGPEKAGGTRRERAPRPHAGRVWLQGGRRWPVGRSPATPSPWKILEISLLRLNGDNLDRQLHSCCSANGAPCVDRTGSFMKCVLHHHVVSGAGDCVPSASVLLVTHRPFHSSF
jgi:hypothetical protein